MEIEIGTLCKMLGFDLSALEGKLEALTQGHAWVSVDQHGGVSFRGDCVDEDDLNDAELSILIDQPQFQDALRQIAEIAACFVKDIELG